MSKLTVLVGIFSFCSVCFATPVESKATGCTVAPSDLATNHPLLLIPDTTDEIEPDLGSTEILLSSGDTIELSCPGTTVEGTDETTAIATCTSGVKFSVNGKSVSINTISCDKKPENTAKYSGNTCDDGSKEILIGFDIDENRFKTIIYVCFIDDELTPAYSYYYLTKSIGSAEVNVARPSFVEDDFYNLNEKLNNMYTKENQKISLNQQLGLPDSSDKYVSTGNYYLAKGHLTAKADFIYAPGQIATFHYVNTAPQWQAFNSINWFALESNARTYAETNDVDLVVYTGNYGILTYPHEDTGKDVEIYLYVDEDGEKYIPVPELFWKILYEPEGKAAVAVIGVNNPYIEDPTDSIICEDISDDLTWLTMDKHKIEAGYTYACTFDDLKKTVEHLPDIDVKAVLK